MMTFSAAKSPVGEIRPSQLLRDFGVGALVDLPNISAIVLGLEDWEQYYQQQQEIGEERLRLAVRQWLGQQVSSLRTPPVPPEGASAPSFGLPTMTGVPVAAFPRWMVCSYCHLLAPVESGLFQLKTDPHRSDRARYIHANCIKPGTSPTALPARFLTVCERGHLDDFPWVYYVHRGGNNCETPLLKLREGGFSSDITDVRVHCETCSAFRSMADAFAESARAALPQCRGRRPHLRDFEDSGCEEQTSTLLLGASNTWFPVLLSALSIPKEVDPLGKLLDVYWPQLEKAENTQNVELMRILGLLPQLAQFTSDEIWEAIEHRRGESAEEGVPADLKAPEWRIFNSGADVLDHPYFRIRNATPPPGLGHLMERVVLAERLREVNALVGFTRLASLGDLAESSDTNNLAEQRMVQFSRRPPTWVPAFEVHGEGIFLQFREEIVAGWLENCETLNERDNKFRRAHYYWRARRHLQHPDDRYPGLRYVLLHSFAHALMRQLSLEAGYSMASLSERIYSRSPREDGGPMAGVLIYTSAPDSEGTLGGLVSLGAPEQLTNHILAALENIRWCASDPLCAGHLPRDDADELHGAACHACLFAPETSCERGNRYLDRSLLIPTIDQSDMAFFADSGPRSR